MKINPCKNCKSNKYLQWHTWQEKNWWIHCNKCGRAGRTGRDQKATVDFWNENNKIDKKIH